MAKSEIQSADAISAAEFQEYLDKYTACIETISESKGAKDGQRTLAELDEYRYGEAVDTFSGNSEKSMELEDVKALVEWKLRHGKFRPTLMKLVSSNEADFVKNTIQNALKAYRKTSDVSAALDALTKLKGIGPATASLLLAVHDPARVVFFADEAFYWLCCNGRKDPIKYNAKEYKALNERAEGLATRLGVKAVDIERVAFTIIRDQTVVPDSTAKPPKSKSTTSGKDAKPPEKQPGKRKVSADAEDDTKDAPRRSKRTKS